MSRVLDLVIAWPSIAVCVGASLLTGCGPGEIDNDFRVTAIDYDGDTRLLLTFSNPIANADEIDPTAFRISYAITSYLVYAPGYIYQGTYYQSVGEYSYPEGYTDLEFVSASLGATPTQLVLELSAPIDDDVCYSIGQFEQYFADYVAQYPGSKADIGLFLHYAAGDIPLTGTNGQVLADIGRDWVLTEDDYLYRETYGFTQLTPRLEIPCN